MKSKKLIFKQLPMLMATGVLSAGLLLSGCSNSNDSDSVQDTDDNSETTKTVVATEDGSPVVESQNLESETATDADIADNSNNKDENVEVATNGATVSKTISPIAAATKQPSLLTNPTQAGTAEDTVKLALDTLYYGDVEKAATYYKVDMENFSEELKNTQFAFQQTVEAVTITNTKYNSDKTRATVTGELMLKGQEQPAPLTYELQKIAGIWKILG